jgi:hypothetical protein
MKFVLIAVFLMDLPQHDPPTPPQVHSVEVWGAYATLEACEKARDVDRDIPDEPPKFLAYLECATVEGEH